MKKSYLPKSRNYYLVLLWLGFLFSIQYISRYIIPRYPLFHGPIPWANFDGVHYLSIARNGYSIHQQAFFPLFPLLIYIFTRILRIDTVFSAFLVVYASFFLALFFFRKLVSLDYDSHAVNWATVFLLAFPTSFFLISIYSEGLFLFLIFVSFYFARKKRFLLASIFGAFSSATRLIGILLLPALLIEIILFIKREKSKNWYKISQTLTTLLLVPVGLFTYMFYLAKLYGDPLLFIHSQPAFGAGRSGGQIIFLPQVFFRYFKIFTTLPLSNYSYWIAVLEIFVFLFVLLVLLLAFKAGIRKSYIIFSFLSLVVPTLSGTLSSIPRYAITSFAIFIFFAVMKNRLLRYSTLFISIVLDGVLAMLFFQGYFVS